MHTVFLACDHVYQGWHIEQSSGKVYSEWKPHRSRRIVDDFHENKIYQHSQGTYEVKQIPFDLHPSLPPYQALPKAYSDEVMQAIQKGHRLVTANGYCAYAPAIVGGMQRALGLDQRIGVIWLDAHSDNVIVEQTSRDLVTFVGVPLSTILGQTLPSWRIDSCGLTVPIEGQRVLVSDARLNDAECTNNMVNANVQWINEEEFEQYATWEKTLDSFLQQLDVVYLMIDADILKPEEIPAYYETEPGGHGMEVVLRNVKPIMESGKVIALSTFCFDFDRYEQGGAQTSISAQRLLKFCLQHWK